MSRAGAAGTVADSRRDHVRLGTRRAVCPNCGADDPKPHLSSAPAQLIDLDQSFNFGRCGQCLLIYLLDPVVDASIGALYDADYPLHTGPAIWGPFARLVADDQARLDRARVAVVEEFRSIGPDDAVLDVGCGRPTFLATLREKTNCRAYGVDVVEPIEDPRFAGLHVSAGMPPDWPAAVDAAAPFAAATMWHYLEHDPHPVETLRSLRERMRPDGVAVVEVPDVTGATARWLGSRWPGFHTPRHMSVFAPDTLRALCENAGWRVVAARRSGTLAPFVLVALAALDRAGFRFGRHSAPLVFPLWAAGMGLTWPLLGRPEREGLGIQTIVLAPK